MAIHSSLPGITITINSSNEPLPEYASLTPSRDLKTITSYIQCQYDDLFFIRIESKKPYECDDYPLCFEFRVDYGVSASVIMTPELFAKPLLMQNLGTFNGSMGNRNWLVQKLLRFAPPKAALENVNIQKLKNDSREEEFFGLIEIKVFKLSPLPERDDGQEEIWINPAGRSQIRTCEISGKLKSFISADEDPTPTAVFRFLYGSRHELTVWGVGQRSMESFKAEEIKTLAQMKYYDDRCQKHLLTPWYGDQDAKGFEELSNDERYELFRLKYLEIAQRKV